MESMQTAWRAVLVLHRGCLRLKPLQQKSLIIFEHFLNMMLKMCWALVTMGFVLLMVFILSTFDQRAAYRVLQFGQTELFEGEDQQGRKTSPVKRGYISPYMRNQVAQSQHWRCNICGKELDASFDLDQCSVIARRLERPQQPPSDLPLALPY